ncbi:arylesterase [Lysobacteraceae bacterium NML120232]|nr:arylesterase [Xanthomonadaceae bacterium NML120232]PJK11039.1 arylesterase [Xanthomonadaceae bacterium NML08-0793]
MNRHRFLARFFALSVSLLLLAACGNNPPKQAALPSSATVLALGDSLTQGVGAGQGQDYPSQLAQITGWKIINGGVSGDTSAQALVRLPELLKQKPDLVLVGIGGNDFLRRLPEDQTRANISQIISTTQAENIPVVLIAVPQLSVGALFGNLSDSPIYQDLAKQHQVPLLEETWAEILGDNSLKSDQIHANAQGYRRFAEKMAAFLQHEGFR